MAARRPARWTTRRSGSRSGSRPAAPLLRRSVVTRALNGRGSDLSGRTARSGGGGRASSGRDSIPEIRFGLTLSPTRSRRSIRPGSRWTTPALELCWAPSSGRRRCSCCAAAPACGKTPPRPRWWWRTRPASSGRAVASAARARCGAPLTVLCGSVSPPNPAPAAGRVHRGPTRPPGGCWNGSPSGARANTGGSSATTSRPSSGPPPSPPSLPRSYPHPAGPLREGPAGEHGRGGACSNGWTGLPAPSETVTTRTLHG